MKIEYARDISCCRYNNLVYARTLKAGSEFFYRNFTQTAGWTPIKYTDIDWNHDTVFSYIMDPIQRRNKGISEAIISAGAQDMLIKNKGNFVDILKRIPFLDAHSASLHDIYGNDTRRIYWLLMTNDHQVAIRETEKFFAKYNVPPIKWNVNFTHATRAYMSEVYTHVKAAWDRTTEPQKDFTVQNYFLADIELYNEVLTKYNQAQQAIT